jgi:hypothetical protein
MYKAVWKRSAIWSAWVVPLFGLAILCAGCGGVNGDSEYLDFYRARDVEGRLTGAWWVSANGDERATHTHQGNLDVTITGEVITGSITDTVTGETGTLEGAILNKNSGWLDATATYPSGTVHVKGDMSSSQHQMYTDRLKYGSDLGALWLCSK